MDVHRSLRRISAVTGVFLFSSRHVEAKSFKSDLSCDALFSQGAHAREGRGANLRAVAHCPAVTVGRSIGSKRPERDREYYGGERTQK